MLNETQIRDIEELLRFATGARIAGYQNLVSHQLLIRVHNLLPQLRQNGSEAAKTEAMGDAVNHPQHYNSLPAKCACGRHIECIQVVEHFDFLLGNVIKYGWRGGHKAGVDKLEDLEKMLWYAQRAVDKERNNRNAGN